VDEDRNPVKVPPLQADTEEQKRRFVEAEKRREYRKSLGN
jgi:acyl-CoA hydrolase